MVVIDTSPLNYLILIKQINLLPQLYGRVLIPGSVHKELTRRRRLISSERGELVFQIGLKFRLTLRRPNQI